MKTLFILRHAEAAPDRGGGDYERVLTERGHEMAKALGEIMAEKNYVPQFAFCSGATRTRQTLEGVLECVRIGTVEHTKEIYHADVNDLIELVRGIDDKYESVLIVGHNPTVHQSVAALTADDSPFLEALSRGYAPATLSVLQVPRARWVDLTPGENRLVDIATTD
jgi:phosphohistidine phosphatase